METSTATPLGSPPLPRRRGVRFLRVLTFALLVLVLLSGLLLGALRAARAGALPGVAVGEMLLGGLPDDAVARALERLERQRAERVVTVVTPAGQVQAPAGELGYDLDVSATLQRVLARGRQRNPVVALRDQLRAFGGTIDVDAVESVDGARLGAWAQQAAAQLEVAPQEGTLAFEGAEVRRVDPVPGARVRRAELLAAARAAVLGTGPATVRAEVEPLTPKTTSEDVDEVLAAAQRALSGPVRLVRNGGAITFTPEEIAALLEVREVPASESGDQSGGESADLELTLAAERLGEVVSAAEVAAVERAPRNASVVVSAGVVSISDSEHGFAFSPASAAAQLFELATSHGPREARLEGEVVEPALTTEQARALQVSEPVASFTTHHKCCQSRVTNIHRIADLVDGVLILPGQTFSVNDHVGRRTVEKGFVEGGAIFDGEYVEEVGGGVSQFATTMFNAAYFGGYAIPQHKPHSYYISRYPVGREATLSYPHVDLKVRNNSPYGLVVKTSYTATSITVTLWGKKWVEVESVTGERRNIKQPETQVRENPDLPPGTSRVVQQPAEGFDITVTRTLRFPDGDTKREQFSTRYQPQPKIIERNSSGAGADEGSG